METISNRAIHDHTKNTDLASPTQWITSLVRHKILETLLNVSGERYVVASCHTLLNRG